MCMYMSGTFSAFFFNTPGISFSSNCGSGRAIIKRQRMLAREQWRTKRNIQITSRPSPDPCPSSRRNQVGTVCEWKAGTLG